MTEEPERPIDLGMSASQARVNALLLVSILYLERLKAKGLVECQTPITPRGRQCAEAMLAAGFKPTDDEMGLMGRHMARQNALPKAQVDNFIVLLIGERDGVLTVGDKS